MSWQARRYLTKHHNLPRSRHGKSTPDNLITLTAEKHQLLHKLFGNRTIAEIIEVLKRLERMKYESAHS